MEARMDAFELHFVHPRFHIENTFFFLFYSLASIRPAASSTSHKWQREREREVLLTGERERERERERILLAVFHNWGEVLGVGLCVSSIENTF
jgi:hypothetical protein